VIQTSPLQLRAQAELERRKRKKSLVKNYESYQSDPAGFGRDHLGQEYTADIVRVMESVRDNMVTFARSANGVGKTHGAASLAAWFYKCFPDSQVYTAAAPPHSNLRRLLWGEIGQLITGSPSVFASDDPRMMLLAPPTPQGIEPKTFVVGVTIPTSGTPEQRKSKFSGKHSPHLLFIIDEGDAVPPEVYEAIEGCMSGGDARLLVLFNPRCKAGHVYQKAERGEANIIQLSAFDHPNVVVGSDVIPGAVTRETTVRRINQWTRPLAQAERPDNESFEVPDFLVGSVAKNQRGVAFPPLPAGWRHIENPAFFYMVLGEYPAQSETQLISLVWIEAARARWDAYVAQHGEIPPEGTRAIVGLDVAEFGQDSNSFCPRYGGWVARLTKWGGVDADMTAIKGAEHCKRIESRLALVDATGVGAGVAPRMNRLGIRARPVKVAESPTVRVEEGEFYQLRDQLWWLCREWLRTDLGAMLPPDERLLAGLQAPSYVKDKRTGKIKVTDKETLKEMLGYSPDEADSLCLTFAPSSGSGVWV